MISLPQDWQSITGGAVAAHLLGQVSDNAMQQQVGSHLIGVSLELAAAGIFMRTQYPVAVEPLPDGSWRIGDYTYVYLHDINNGALRRAVEIGSHRFFGSIVVPPRHDEVLWRACLSILGKQAPSILGLDSLLNLRVLFSSVDFHWPNWRVLLEIAYRYNRRMRDTEYDDAILIDIPPECSRLL